MKRRKGPQRTRSEGEKKRRTVSGDHRTEVRKNRTVSREPPPKAGAPGKERRTDAVNRNRDRARGRRDVERWSVCLTRFLVWQLSGEWLACAECPIRRDCRETFRDENVGQ
ncbi:MAG: hypothetical protein IKO83_04170 [Oscillospiraceae bacterium]|nr:hypothetical protein [Oscillospiraceae bacterium]